MSTDARRSFPVAETGRMPGPARRTSGLFAGALIAVLAAVAPARAQVPVDAETRVRSIRFDGAREVSEGELRALLETRDRGAAYGLRVALGKLPLVPDPAPKVFVPIELQRDVVRIRERYRASGFHEATVRYDVRLDAGRNLLDIVFRIVEGAPTRIVEASVVGPDGASAPAIPDSLARSWERVARAVERLEGRRLDVSRLQQVERRLRSWWRDHGHPQAEAPAEVTSDSLRHEARLRFAVVPGPAARFGAVAVGGEPSISDRTVLRELPFRAGDPYSAAALEEGRTQLEGLQIVRGATFDIPSATGDSAVARGAFVELPVGVRLLEAKPRLIGGGVGYGTEAGASAEARWEHRNFLGAARLLTVAAVAQTGRFAIVENPDERYRASVSLLQPYLLQRRVSALLSPFVEQRDDYRDRSLEIGANATILYGASAGRSVSLDYRVGQRRVYEYRLGDLGENDLDFTSLLGLLSQGFFDSLGTTLRSSTFTLAGNLGAVDRPGDPRRGVLVRPSLQVAAPAPFTSAEYWRLDGSVQGFVPLAPWAHVAARIGAGHLIPFGRSLPTSPEDRLLAFFRLRDVLMTAGGSGDVRGWGQGLLGPKIEDLRIVPSGDSLRLEADGYVPLGGFSRVTGSLELRLPLPPLGSTFGSHLFLDGGRVWTGHRDFDLGSSAYGQEDWFYAAGAGIDLRTPVGPIRLSAGYKLNPSITDLVSAGDLLRAEIEGRPPDDLPRRNSRRWQIHLAVGSAY